MKIYMVRDFDTTLAIVQQRSPAKPCLNAECYRGISLRTPEKQKRSIYAPPKLEISPHSSSQKKKYYERLTEMMTEWNSAGLHLDVIATRVREFEASGGSKWEISVEVAVASDYLRELVGACSSLGCELALVQVKIKDIHFDDNMDGIIGRTSGTNFCTTKRLDGCCSGLNIEIDKMLMEQGQKLVSDTKPKLFTWTDDMWESWCSKEKRVCAKISIAVRLGGAEGMGTPKTPTIYERLLKEEVLTDLTIVAAKGVAIRCHRAFLGVQSPVLAAILQGDMGKAQGAVNTVEMLEMSEAAVKALLAFLYYEEYLEAHKNCEIAYQLFEAGCKYGILKLKTVMKTVILDKPLWWLGADSALRLFLLIWNLENYGELKMKAVGALRANLGDLQSSPIYYQMFIDNPDAAKDLYENLSTNEPEIIVLS